VGVFRRPEGVIHLIDFIASAIMCGWVRTTPDVYRNDALRQKLVDRALTVAGSLPQTEAIAGTRTLPRPLQSH
jgi:hypothetical protein